MMRFIIWICIMLFALWCMWTGEREGREGKEPRMFTDSDKDNWKDYD
jgi:hypothetical protein